MVDKINSKCEYIKRIKNIFYYNLTKVNGTRAWKHRRNFVKINNENIFFWFTVQSATIDVSADKAKNSPGILGSNIKINPNKMIFSVNDRYWCIDLSTKDLRKSRWSFLRCIGIYIIVNVSHGDFQTFFYLLTDLHETFGIYVKS